MKTFKPRRQKLKTFAKGVLLLIFALTLTLVFLQIKSPLVNMNFITYTSAFNLLFILTIFPLKGRIPKKLSILALGNILSFIWNGLYPYYLFSFFPKSHLLNNLLSLISPIVNTLWIISIWGLGLSSTAPFELEELKI